MTIAKGLAGVCVVALMASVSVLPATAQDQYGYGNPPPPNGNYPAGAGGQGGEMAPPQGQYAPAPQGTEEGGTYDEQQQQADEAYAQDYARWAARYCVNQANNTVAGALIGGILGAGIGAAVTHNPATGAAIGGAIGAGTGAAAGASYGGGACPPGYVAAAGAPAFYYSSPYYASAPAWYHPWVWAGGRWVYHPYRFWYWNHRAFWRPGWRAGPGRWRRRR
ncbi:MAG: hypothetical protein ACREHF_05505 [Rhizomicrobium sp.]